MSCRAIWPRRKSFSKHDQIRPVIALLEIEHKKFPLGKSSIRAHKRSEMKTKLFITTHPCRLFAAVLALSSFALAQHKMEQDSTSIPPNLVQLVRAATEKYINVNAATAAGYAPFLGCVTGSDHGAMGVHYVNGTLLNGPLDISQPQALIYEPSNGGLQLVGVEYIIFADPWLQNNNNIPPVLDGQVLQFVDSPNRFNIPAFFELHVWAWRANPQGAYVDWNNDVTCTGE